VAERQGKLIGLQVASIIDGGQTIFCQRLRIHREYRGGGHSYQIYLGIRDRVREIHPEASKSRFMAQRSNVLVHRFAKRLDYKVVLDRNEFKFEVTDSNSVLFRGIYNEFKELYELGGKDTVEFVLNKRKFDSIIPHKIMVVKKDPYEITQASQRWICV
jgi:hypothetical protein